MDLITRLKRFDFWGILLGILLSSSGLAERMPTLYKSGILPVSFQGGFLDKRELGAAKKVIAEGFATSVRKLHRFDFLPDALVAKLWDERSTRTELREKYEISSYVSLAASEKSDQVMLIIRLLSPTLEAWMQETMSLDQGKFQRMSNVEVMNTLFELSARLFNRLPQDVNVTSIQGRYITLSGGSSQGVTPGLEIDLVRARVASIHPALHTWLDFAIEPLGKAVVTEVDDLTSVAKITSQTYPSSVGIGDGAIIPSIAGRPEPVKKKKTFTSEPQTESVIISPLYTSVGAKGGATSTPEEPSYVESIDDHKVFVVMDSPAPHAPSSEMPLYAGTGTALPKKTGATPLVIHRSEKDMTLFVGIDLWSVKGGTVCETTKNNNRICNSIATHEKFNVLPNTVAFEYKAPYDSSFLYAAKADLGFGGTAHDGRYTRFSGEGRAIFEKLPPLEFMDYIQKWSFGGLGRLSVLSVSDETFGGADALSLGGFVEVEGKIDLYSFTHFEAGFEFLPLGFGRAGYGGSFHSMSSLFGTALGARFWHESKVWGIGLGYETVDIIAGKGISMGSFKIDYSRIL